MGVPYDMTVPLNLLDDMVACGVNNVNLFDVQTMAQRLAMKSDFHHSFSFSMYYQHKEPLC